MYDVVVVGSINQDVTASVERLPGPGETVLASGHVTGAGGKGANQAVAAARLGRSVAMIGRVGDDAAGQALVEGMASYGVDTSGISIDPYAATGLALITVDASGENQIVVSPGANALLGPNDVSAWADGIRSARVLLAQLEVPLETIEAAAALGTATVILNPAPAAPLQASLLDHVDILVPNRSELGILAGGADVSSDAAVARAARRLDVPAVVVTLGADGAILVTADDTRAFPAPAVVAVDTVGAGDAFCAALADAVARGEPLDRAVAWATAAGALAATEAGAQGGLTGAEAVAELMEAT